MATRIYLIIFLLFIAEAGSAQSALWNGVNSTASDISRSGNVATTGMIQLDAYEPGTAQIRLNSSGNYYGKIGTPLGDTWSLGWGNSGTDLNSVLHWNTGGHVGIGTSSPYNPDGWGRVLDVNGGGGSAKIISTTTNVRTGLYSLMNAGGWNGLNGDFGLIGTESSHDLVFMSGYAPKMVLNTSGNASLGTLSPFNTQGWDRVLDVTGPAHAKIIASASNNAVRTGIYSHQNWQDGGGAVGIIGTESNHNLHFFAGYNTKMVVTTSGNVGIGTTNPISKFQIGTNPGGWSGNDLVVSNANGGIAISTGSTESYLWGSKDIAIRPGNGVTAVYAKTNGSVGIGTSSPRGRLDVFGGDTYLSDDPNVGTAQSLYLPGHILISPYAGTNVSYLQARRLNNSGTTALRIRTYNNGNLSEAMHIEGNGNVGIGTTAPTNKLEVAGSTFNRITAVVNADVQNGLQIKRTGTNATDWEIYNPAGSLDLRFFNGTDLFTLKNNGSLGIGTSAPQAKLHVSGGNLILDNAASPTIYTGTGGTELNRYLVLANSPTLGTASGLKAGGVLIADSYGYANPGKNDLIVKGKVGIGTPFNGNTNNYALAVNGKIGGHDVQIERISNAWSDYVFEADYKLAPLYEVEQFIKENGHLKDVPSAKEVEKNGYSVSSMDATLLRKIEELTLYLLAQQKEIEELKKQLEKK